jgi:glycosyltransferase involved in cell wall biosynthesis
MPWHISERGGGAEVQANYLARELASRGFEVSYICQTVNQSKVNAEETLNSYKVYWLKSSGSFAWLDQKKYYHKLMELLPEVVLQRMTSNVSYPIGKYCEAKNKLFHWFCTDNEAPFKTFHRTNFKKRLSLNLTNFLKYLLFYCNARIMDYYRNKGMKRVDVAWSQNNFQKEKLLETFKLKTHTMITGHPLPDRKIDHEENFNRKTVLWCGNLGLHKRPELFVALAKRLQHTNIRFIMVGGHNKSTYVNRLFKHKPENLEVVGKCSFEESISFFNKSTVLVNTSKAEGFSNTYIQAWLRGVPTLVMGADPNHVIRNNELGYDCLNVADLEEKLLILLNHKDEYIAISKRVKQYAEQNHSVKVMTDNFLKHLKP